MCLIANYILNTIINNIISCIEVGFRFEFGTMFETRVHDRGLVAILRIQPLWLKLHQSFHAFEEIEVGEIGLYEAGIVESFPGFGTLTAMPCVQALGTPKNIKQI